MARRVVIHAGFHKTGTSSVQQGLRNNRAALKPYLRAILRAQMGTVVSAARGYSTWRDPITLDKFTRRFGAVLGGLTPMPRRTLCLSAEELSGHLPGRGDLRDYSAAPVLAREMAASVRALWPDTDLVFHYTTRAADAWLRSAYWQHVTTSSLTMDWNEYAETYRTSARLDDIVAEVCIATGARVLSSALEDATAHPVGPLAPLLDTCGVPTDVLSKLAIPPAANTRHDPDVLLALLAANRDYADRDARKAAKLAILAAAQETSG